MTQERLLDGKTPLGEQPDGRCEYYLSFEPKFFVGFADKLVIVQQSLKRAVDENRGVILTIQGGVGSGKTWFLEMVHHRSSFGAEQPLVDPNDLSGKSTISALVDLAKITDDKPRATILQELARQLYSQLPVEQQDLLPQSLIEAGESEEQVEEAFLSSLVSLSQSSYHPILALDGYERIPRELLDWLEKEIVQPITLKGNGSFVFGGRVSHPWKVFEVRIRDMPVKLKPLAIEEIKALLKKREVASKEIGGELAFRLYDYCFGHPLVLGAILERIPELDSTEIEKEETQEKIATLVQELIETCFFDFDKSKDWDLPEILWGICISRMLSPGLLHLFLPLFLGTKYEEKPQQYFSDLLGRFQETMLVYWSSPNYTYVLNPLVRRIMAKNFSMRQPDEFQRRHKTAVESYEKIALKDPRNAATYIIEYCHHRYWASGARGEFKKRIIEDLLGDVNSLWEAVLEHDDVRWDIPEIRTEIVKRLNREKEENPELPSGVYPKLIEIIDEG